jgi:hypothetical protein
MKILFLEWVKVKNNPAFSCCQSSTSKIKLPPLDTTSQYDPRLIYRPVVDYTIVETDLE